MGAGCALALVCACAAPGEAFAQASTAASNPTSAKPKTKTSTTQHTSHPKSTSATAAHSSKSRHASSRKKRVRGQQKIDAERAQSIQAALIREHYLSGAATGTWNQSSEDAMRRYQADHGWQSKTVPDSRALISLGLGPSHDHLLNPESAMTTGPSAPRAASLTPASHSADPGTRMSTPPAAATDHDASGPQ
jgi:hypothetical protein